MSWIDKNGRTTGPWKRSDAPINIKLDGARQRAYVINSAHNLVVAYVFAGAHPDSRPDAEPNADLITAAQEMYAALADIENETREGGQATFEKINERARSAMAKAKGEQQ